MSRVRIINHASSSTGTVTGGHADANGVIDLYQVVGNVTANVSHGSTKTIAWRMQGSLSGVAWTNLNAAATTSTGTAQVNSTVAGSYNQIKVIVTGNATTGNVTTKWSVAGRP